MVFFGGYKSFLWDHWYPRFGPLVMSVLDSKAMTPADLLAASMAANPLWSTYLDVLELRSSIQHAALWRVTRRDCVFYSYFQGSWKIEAFSLCFVFTSTKSPRGPPWNEGHRPKVRHETSILEVPAQEQHEHSFCSSSSNTFITCFLYTVHR